MPLIRQGIGRALLKGGVPVPDTVYDLTTASPSGATVSRASIGYDAAGTTQFAANTLRRTTAGLVNEPASATNLLLDSANLTTSNWTTYTDNGGTIVRTANAAVAPDGTTTATLFNVNRSNANGFNISQQNFTAPVSGYYSLGFWLWAATPADVGKTITFLAYTGSSGPGLFNVILTATPTRYKSETFMLAAGAQSVDIGLWPSTLYGASNQTGQVQFYVWGAMLQVGNKLTSYTTATRAAETISLTLPFTGAGHVIFTFDDGTRQGLNVTGPSYTIPALSRSTIKTLAAGPGSIALPLSYKGPVATRTAMPNAFNSGYKYKQFRRQHIARDAITSLQLVSANFFVSTSVSPYNRETATGAASTISRSVEYPAGTFTQVKYGGANTGSIPNRGTLTSDATTVAIPQGAIFWVDGWEYNPAGIVMTNYGQNPKLAGSDYFQYSASALTDQTMTGISSSTGGEGGTSFTSDVAIIGTTSKSTVFMIGDSRDMGAACLPTSAGDMGEIATSISPVFAGTNAGTSGDFVSAFVADHANRLQIGLLHSHWIVQSGVNDLYASPQVSATALAASRANVVALAEGRPVFETTIPPETNSTDGWTTSSGQTAVNSTYNTQRVNFNNSVRAGSPGMAGYFELADRAETARDSGIWKYPGIVFDGVHETLAGNQAYIPDINTALFVRT